MLKKLFIFLFLILIIVYLVIAVTVLNAKPNTQTCDGMELVIKDSIDYGFISKREVLRLLNGKKLSPTGKTMGEINTRELEDELRKHPLIGILVDGTPTTLEVSQLHIELFPEIPVFITAKFHKLHSHHPFSFFL